MRSIPFWLLAGVVFVSAYFSALSTNEFGVQDDYNLLYSSKLNPGGLIQICATAGRPLYGFIAEACFARAETHNGLLAMRWLSLGFLVATALGVRWMVREAGVPRFQAGLVAVLAGLFPAAQIIVSWATIGPYLLASLGGAVAFALTARSARVERGRWWQRGGAVLAFAGGLCIFQPGPFIYGVGVGAVFLLRRQWSLRALRDFLVLHAGVVFAGGLVAWLFFQAVLTVGGWEVAPRVGVTDDLARKWAWFLDQPLSRVLSWGFLQYEFGFDAGWRAWIDTAAGWLTAGLVGLAVALELPRRNGLGRVVLVVGLAALFPAIFCISLLASENHDSYRTLFPLFAYWILLVVWALRSLTRRLPRVAAGRIFAGCAVGLVSLAWGQAHFHVETLVVRPQALEYALARRHVASLDLAATERVRIHLAAWGDQPCFTWDGEFGCPTLAFEWGASFLYFMALQERYPEISVTNWPVSVEMSYEPPPDSPPEPGTVLFDARTLRQFRHPHR